MVYITIQQPPPTSPPQPHTVCIIHTVHLLWEGGGEVREKVEGQQYTSTVPSSMGATIHKLGRQYQPWVNVLYLQSIKSVKHNAAKSVNRSILKKIRHIGFGVFIVDSSMVCLFWLLRAHVSLSGSRSVALLLILLHNNALTQNSFCHERYHVLPRMIIQLIFFSKVHVCLIAYIHL